MRYFNFVLLIVAFAFPSIAQDTREHFFGHGRATFVSYWDQSQTCSYTADVEFQYLHTPFYSSAFTYTLRNMVFEDSNCFAVDSEPFAAMCRAWTTSVGTMNVDIPGMGMIEITPRDPELRRSFTNSVKNSEFGFGVLQNLNYQTFVLPDGGVQIFAYK